MEQCAEAAFQAWREPFVLLRIPLLVDLRRDPYERGMLTSNTIVGGAEFGAKPLMQEQPARIK
jgi:hypothetical protein